MHQLTLSKNNPFNTTVTDATGRVLYVVSSTSPWTLHGRTTTIARPDGQQGEVAILEWNATRMKLNTSNDYGRMGGHSDTFTYGGQTYAFKEFMPTKGTGFTGARKFIAPNGREYVWRTHTTSSQLSAKDTGEPVAEMKWHLMHKTTLEVVEEAMDMLDMILITWIYVEKKRKDVEQAAGVAPSM